MLPAEDRAEVLAYRIEPDVLDGDDLLVHARFLAAPDSLPDVDPVDGLVASAAMTRSFDEGFQEHCSQERSQSCKQRYQLVAFLIRHPGDHATLVDRDAAPDAAKQALAGRREPQPVGAPVLSSA